MKFTSIRNQGGWSLTDLIFTVVVIGVLVWLVKQYMLHPEGAAPRPATHSVLEDAK